MSLSSEIRTHTFRLPPGGKGKEIPVIPEKFSQAVIASFLENLGKENFSPDQWPVSDREAFASLAREKNPEIFVKGILRIARQWEQQGRGELGAVLLTSVLQGVESDKKSAGILPQTLRRRVKREKEALEGQGSFGSQAEFFISRLVDQAGNPVSLLGFGMAAGAYQAARYGFLSRWLFPAARSSIGGILGKNLAASIVGVAAESTAITLGMRGIYQLIGYSQDWSAKSLGKDLLAAGITFGWLRGAGALAREGFNGLHGISLGNPVASEIRLPALSQYSRVLFPQTAMLGAIMLARHTEGILGLRSEARGAGWLAESLATWAQFNVAGQFFEGIQPRGFRRWRDSLETLSDLRLREALRTAKEDAAETFSGDGSYALPVGASGTLSSLPPRSASILSVFKNLRLFMSKGKDDPDGKDPEVIPSSVRGLSPSRLTPKETFWSKVEFLEQAPFPVLITDPTGEIRYANLQATQQFGNGEIPLMGHHIDEILQMEGEKRCRPLTGRDSLLYFEKEVRQVPSEADYEIHFFKEVGDTRALEEKIQSLEDPASKTEIMATLLHDIRNLLIPLEYFNRVIQPKFRQYYDRIAPKLSPRREVEQSWGVVSKFSDTIETVIQLLRTGDGLLRGEQVPLTDFDLTDILEKSLSSQDTLREESSIELEKNFPSELAAFGNRILIRNAVTNLVRNAYQAMPQGGRLKIEAIQLPQATQITISDTGSGIDPDILPRIFEKRFTTKRHGSGLGLFWVQKTVEDFHKGRIEVESELGKGSTFRVYLPHEQFSPPEEI